MGKKRSSTTMMQEDAGGDAAVPAPEPGELEALRQGLQRCVLDAPTAAPCSELHVPVQRTNTGRAGAGATFFAIPLDFIPLAEDPELQGKDSFTVDVFVVSAKKDSPGTAAAPFDYAKSSRIKDAKKLLDFNANGKFVVDSRPGEEGMVFHAFELNGKNRGPLVAPGKSFTFTGGLIMRFWQKVEDLAERTKFDNSGPLGPKLFGGRMGSELEDLCRRPFELRTITLQQKNEGSFEKQTALKLQSVDKTAYELPQFVDLMRAKLPKSRVEAVRRSEELLQSTDIPYAKQVPHKGKDAQGNALEKPEITKAVFLQEGIQNVCFRYEDSAGDCRMVCVTFSCAGGGSDMQVLVPAHIFKKNANAATLDDAREMYTIAASVPGALVALVCWDTWLKKQDRWCAEFAPNTFEHCGCLVLDTRSLLRPLYNACMRAEPALVVRQQGAKRRVCDIDMGCTVSVNEVNTPLQVDVTVQPRQIAPGQQQLDPDKLLHYTRVAPHGAVPYASAVVAVFHAPDGTVLFNMDINLTRDAGPGGGSMPPGKVSFQRQVRSAIDDDDDEQQQALDAVA